MPPHPIQYFLQANLRAPGFLPSPTAVAMNDVAHALVLTTAGANQTRLESNLLTVDPEGVSEILTLPPEAESDGLFILIANTADAAETVVVEDDAAAVIITLEQNEAGALWCDGVAWHGFVGGVT